MHAWSITGQIRGKNTLTTYRFVLERFAGRFGKRKVADITSEMVFSFLAAFTEKTEHPVHLVLSPSGILQPRH
jgi:hypothetical protein